MDETNDVREAIDAFCAGAEPPKNGLEERLDMIALQLSSIAYELHEMNGRMPHGTDE